MLVDKNKFFDVLRVNHTLFRNTNNYFFFVLNSKEFDYELNFKSVFNFRGSKLNQFSKGSFFYFTYSPTSILSNLNFIHQFGENFILNAIIHNNRFLSVNNNNIGMFLYGLSFSDFFISFVFIFLNILVFIIFFLKKLINYFKFKLC